LYFYVEQCITYQVCSNICRGTLKDQPPLNFEKQYSREQEAAKPYRVESKGDSILVYHLLPLMFHVIFAFQILRRTQSSVLSNLVIRLHGLGGGKKISWVKWESVCQHKSNGGLGGEGYLSDEY